eukprot:gene9115-1417_t
MSFKKESFIQKLKALSTTQDSIQSLSLWLFHFAKYASEIVKVWVSELKQALPNQKLKFVYLANDVILQGRKKNMAYVTALKPVLVDSLAHVYKVVDNDGKQQLARIISIWQDRSAYPIEFLNELRKAMRGSEEQTSDELKEVDLGESINKQSLFTSVSEHEAALPSISTSMSKMSSLPPNLFDERYMGALESLEAVSKEEIIMEQTQKDIKNLIEKLQQFLSDGNSLTPDVSRCILQEKHGIAQAQLDLQVCKDKATKLNDVAKRLKEHVSNLPTLDLSSSTAAARLPDAADLFADPPSPAPKNPKLGD